MLLLLGSPDYDSFFCDNFWINMKLNMIYENGKKY